MTEKTIKARDLEAGMLIQNPVSEEADIITLDGVWFLAGESYETDEVGFHCKYGSSSVNANIEVYLHHNSDVSV